MVTFNVWCSCKRKWSQLSPACHLSLPLAWHLLLLLVLKPSLVHQIHPRPPPENIENPITVSIQGGLDHQNKHCHKTSIFACMCMPTQAELEISGARRSISIQNNTKIKIIKIETYHLFHTTKMKRSNSHQGLQCKNPLPPPETTTKKK